MGVSSDFYEPDYIRKWGSMPTTAYPIVTIPNASGDITPPTPKGVDHSAPFGPEIFESFKDSQGRYRTQSLFYETRHDSYPAFFTIKKYDIEKDGKKYISLYLKYMEISDPTEYQVALRLFGSWDHWQALLKAKWFRDEVTGWREELKVKLESERFYEMKEAASEGNPVASKWLAERYGDKQTAKRGRPSKAETEAHLKRVAEQTAELDEDAERLGLT